MADLLIAPYIPLSETVAVGPWTLVPFGKLAGSDLVADEVQRTVDRLVEAYRLSPAGGVQALGAVAILEGGRIGSPFDRSLMPRLGHALLAGAVSGNPAMAAEEDDDDLNAGWSVATVENSLLYGHPLIDSDIYAVESGVLARTNAIRHASGDDPLPTIDPPIELPRPMFARFDDDLASATYTALGSEDAPARRLHRALDWYRIALSNAEAVSLDIRVGAARSAFELLADAGDETKRLVRSYGKLMKSEDTTSTTREGVFWAKGPVELTTDEWWMTRLCELRNAIVHGQQIPAELWEHEGLHQLNHIHDRLIVALRISVADRVGDASLRLAMQDRVWVRAAEQATGFLSRQQKQDS